MLQCYKSLTKKKIYIKIQSISNKKICVVIQTVLGFIICEQILCYLPLNACRQTRNTFHGWIWQHFKLWVYLDNPTLPHNPQTFEKPLLCCLMHTSSSIYSFFFVFFSSFGFFVCFYCVWLRNHSICCIWTFSVSLSGKTFGFIAWKKPWNVEFSTETSDFSRTRFSIKRRRLIFW